MKKIIVLLFILLIGCSQPVNEVEIVENEEIEEEPIGFYGMEPSGAATLFLLDIVSTPHFEHSALTFVDDTIYWSRFDQPISPDSLHKIMFTKYDDGFQASKTVDWELSGSADSPFYYNNKIYYHSKVNNEFNLYYYDLEKGEEVKIDIETDQGLSCPSVNDEMMVFNMSSEERPGTFIMYVKHNETEPQLLLSDSDNMFLNINPFINETGDMLLYASVYRMDGKGAADLYVSFKSDEGTWCEGINLGDINTESNERFPSLSPDGKYLFFVSNRSIPENLRSEEHTQNGLGDVYWVDASFIYELNPYK